MRLSELLNLSDFDPAQDVEVLGLTADSRQVKPGYLFAALSGTQSDGWKFVDAAIEKGAVAVLSDLSHSNENLPVYSILTEDPRLELSTLAARFEGQQPEMIAAVTGTNGKTSVAHFTRQLWELCGKSAASLGTLGVVTSKGAEDLHYTTPDPVLLHQTLHDLCDEGITNVVLEASSHGLDQKRVDGAKVQVGAFTNLTRDHLDYHASADEYLNAKLGLVDRVVVAGGTAVLNADSDVYPEFKAAAEKRGLRVISFGHAGEDIKILSVETKSVSQVLKLSAFGEDYDLELPLVGEFQVSNTACALGMVVASGVECDAVIEALPKLQTVPGRIEKVSKTPNGAYVYVDYAHTPDALETVLKALRPHTDGKLISVFGCGGDRDTGKRPQMGRVNEELSDISILTDDNPRSEDPATIRADVLAACENTIEVGGRREAIAHAIGLAAEGDVVLVAGKGHENGQVIGDQVIPFDDREVVREVIADMKGAV